MLRRGLCAGAVAGLTSLAFGSKATCQVIPGLQGKKALVFGGTSGIGLATALELSKEGVQVVAVSRNPDKAAAETEAHSISLAKCDVRDRDALDALVKAHAPVDIIVAAATGGSRALGPFLTMDMAAYKASFDKLWGYGNIVQAGAPHMAEDGCFVLVSGAPARKARAGQVSLASVGAAVEQFARTIAPEIAPLRINVVAPGVIDTPMFGSPSGARDAKLANATSKNLIPRPGLPEEVAAGVMFVVKNRFVTGTTVDVDGGFLAGPRWDA